MLHGMAVAERERHERRDPLILTDAYQRRDRVVDRLPKNRATLVYPQPIQFNLLARINGYSRWRKDSSRRDCSWHDVLNTKNIFIPMWNR